MNTIPFVSILAFHVHESGRASVAAGQTLAHAVQSPAVRPFVEFADLPPRVVAGRTMTASRLLDVFEVKPHAPDVAYDDINDEMIVELAQEIHAAERAAIDAGMVLVQLNRPWVGFSDLPEQAQTGRKRQAVYLLGKFAFRRHTASSVNAGARRVHGPDPDQGPRRDPRQRGGRPCARRP